jgi:hypothetical protein
MAIRVGGIWKVDMPQWLDSWTIRRCYSQQDLARRWAERFQSQAKARILPIEHTRKILQFGKKAYRKWESEGFPEDFEWCRLP